MKVLMVFHGAPNAPPLDMGIAKRNFPFFFENLKRHEVSVVSLGSPAEEKKFRERFGASCRHVEFVNPRKPKWIRYIRYAWYFISGKSVLKYLFFHPAIQRALNRVCAQEKFDVIHCSTSFLGWYSYPESIPKVGDTQNVEYDLMHRTYMQARNPLRKAFLLIEYKRYRKEELTNSAKFDVMLTTTDRDRELFLRDLPTMPIETIQNGVDKSFFEPQAVEEEPHTMVFMGWMKYPPNDNGASYFLDEIFPLVLRDVPDAKLYIVGADPSKEIRERASRNIIVTGFVPDVRPYLARGEIFIVSLLIGGGIRGKALEAMAMKRPIVTTSIGCEGILLKHEESALFADTPDAFAAAVVRLMNDPVLRRRLADKAYQTVVEHHNWEAKWEQLDSVYRRVVAARSGREAPPVPAPRRQER